MRGSIGGLSGRVLIVAAVGAGLSAVVVTAVVLSSLVGQFLNRAAYMVPQLDPFLRQRCERDPLAFSQTIGPELELSFYDATTLQPADPTMPPPEPELVKRLRTGDVKPSRLYYFWFARGKWGGVALRQVADRGRCSLLQLRWQVARAERNRTWLLIFGLPALSGALAVVLTSFFAVRPLTLRLSRLRRATQKIGLSSGYASADASESDDDVGQLSRLLDQAHARIAADAAASAAREKALEQHLADVAHDLRTPLASLQLTIERLSSSTQLTIAHISDSSQTPDSELVRHAIEDVVYMGALISNLYLACRLQDGVDPLRDDPQVDLCVLVDQVTRRFAKLGSVRAIEVSGSRPDDAVRVRCNPAMAEQVLANLVHNSIAHGEEGGHVAVLLTATAERFTLTVLDDGPGVPPPELLQIGERTFRSDTARQREPSGGGLGLAIAKEICRLAGFTLRFQAAKPRGLEGTVTGDRIRSES